MLFLYSFYSYLKKKIVIFFSFSIYIYIYIHYTHTQSALQKYWNSKDTIALLAVESRHLQKVLGKVIFKKHYNIALLPKKATNYVT